MSETNAADHAAAQRIAREAGALLLTVREAIGEGADNGAVKAEGDRRSHELISTRLRTEFPDDAVLSEEGIDDGTRVGSHRCWVVDPLDGTREFGEPPRDDWAVHVALVVDGVAVCGAVALPARDAVLSTAAPPQAPAEHEGAPRLVVSRTRAPAIAMEVARAIGAETIEMGSAGAKAMAVVLGDADVYLHAGGQYEWDSAAPVAVAVAAGLHASRLDGSSLRYNRPDAYLPDLVICRPELARSVARVTQD